MDQKFWNIYAHASFWYKLLEVEGIDLMLHPAYSPNPACLDFYLFQYMALFL